jgi:two-component system, NarL family, nitrate/nitrite response regulator NarL
MQGRATDSCFTAIDSAATVAEEVKDPGEVPRYPLHPHGLGLAARLRLPRYTWDVASARSVEDLERRLRIVVAGNDPLARGGLHALLSDQPGLSVVAVSGLGQELRQVLLRNQPDASVWDLGVDLKVGVDRLRELEGSIPVLALVTDETQSSELFAAGARGVLLRNSDGQRLSAALFAIVQHIAVLEDSLAVPGLRAHRPDEGLKVDPLTPRESEALQLLAQGLSNKEIAQRLKISEHTAKFHVNAILSKLGVQSRTEAVVRAARLGLILI